MTPKVSRKTPEKDDQYQELWVRVDWMGTCGLKWHTKFVSDNAVRASLKASRLDALTMK